MYQPGATNPCDYASRCPPPTCQYIAEEKERWGTEEEEEDMEILVCRMEKLTGVITMPILIRHTDRNIMLRQLKEDIKKGRLWKELREEGFKEYFHELTIQEEAILRGEGILIPKSLRTGVLEAAHQGHPQTWKK